MATALVAVEGCSPQPPMKKTEMNNDGALQQLSHMTGERAFGRHVGSDRLIQVGLDALIAGVESPALALLAALAD